MRILRDNGLSIALTLLFLCSLAGQTVVGHRTYNEDQREHGQRQLSYGEYLVSSHCGEAVFENWESEFLQMAAYVWITVFLFQRGSAESKDPDQREPAARTRARPSKDAPWPVRRGGLALRIYEHSLTLAFVLLFIVSFTLHVISGAANHSEEQLAHGRPPLSAVEYLATARFWFESFQNWQSEFLAIAAMVVLSIFLRQKGSPESKKVDSPHGETGQ